MGQLTQIYGIFQFSHRFQHWRHRYGRRCSSPSPYHTLGYQQAPGPMLPQAVGSEQQSAYLATFRAAGPFRAGAWSSIHEKRPQGKEDDRRLYLRAARHALCSKRQRISTQLPPDQHLKL